MGPSKETIEPRKLEKPHTSLYRSRAWPPDGPLSRYRNCRASSRRVGKGSLTQNGQPGVYNLEGESPSRAGGLPTINYSYRQRDVGNMEMPIQKKVFVSHLCQGYSARENHTGQLHYSILGTELSKQAIGSKVIPRIAGLVQTFDR
jgi:hypothetical protein